MRKAAILFLLIVAGNLVQAQSGKNVNDLIQKYWVVSKFVFENKDGNRDITQYRKGMFMHFRNSREMTEGSSGGIYDYTWSYDASKQILHTYFMDLHDQYKIVSISESELQLKEITEEEDKEMIWLKPKPYPFYPEYVNTIRDLAYNMESPYSNAESFLKECGFDVTKKEVISGITHAYFANSMNHQIIIEHKNNDILAYSCVCYVKTYKDIAKSLADQGYKGSKTSKRHLLRNSKYAVFFYPFSGEETDDLALKQIYIYDVSVLTISEN